MVAMKAIRKVWLSLKMSRDWLYEQFNRKDSLYVLGEDLREVCVNSKNKRKHFEDVT